MFPTLQMSSRSFEFGSSASSIDWSGLLVIAMMLFLVFMGILFCYALFLTYRYYRNKSGEWNKFMRFIQQLNLTREEVFFIKQTLKKLGIKHPNKIFEKLEVFKREFEKPMEHEGTHTQHLIMSIRQKVFGSNTFHREMM